MKYLIWILAFLGLALPAWSQPSSSSFSAITLQERASAPGQGVNQVKIYSKDVAGVSQVFARYSNGVEVNLADIGSGSFGETTLSTLVNNQTLWSSASASRTLTFGLSGANDPVFTFLDNVVGLNVGLNINGAVNIGGAVTLTNGLTFINATRVTFKPNGTLAGINVGTQAGDPSTLVDGDVWYNSSAGKFRKRENGSTTDLDTPGTLGETALAGLVNDQTLWNSANASRNLTAGLSGATDPVLGFANALVGLQVLFAPDSIRTTNGITDTSLTASRPMLTDSAKRHVSGQIDLANGLHVTGILPSGNVGTLVAGNIGNDTIDNTKIRNSGPLSVIGQAANSTADPADISATAASGAVLRESGSTLGFGTVATAGIANQAVTYAKIQNVTTAKLLGRATAGSGTAEEITLGTGLSLAGTTLNAAGGGEVTSTGVSVDRNVAIANGTTGDIIQFSGLVVNSTNGLSVPAGAMFNNILVTNDVTAASFIVTGAATGGILELSDDDGDHWYRMKPTGITTTNTELILPAAPEDGFWFGTLSQGTNLTMSYVRGNGTKNVVRDDSPFITNATAVTSFTLPNGAAPTTDVFGKLAGDNNAWAASRGAVQFFDGTANTYLVGVLASDTPTAGQVPKWQSGGTITWEDDSTGAGGSPGGSATEIQYNNGSFDGASGFVIPAGQGETNANLTGKFQAYRVIGTNGVWSMGWVQVDGSQTNAGQVYLQSTLDVTDTLSVGQAGIRYLENVANGANYSLIVAPANLAANFTATLPAATGNLVLEDNTATLTGKTYDAAGTGNTLKMTGYITLTHPHNAENAGAVMQTNDVTVPYYGQVLFSNSADETVNYAEYTLTVPEDIDTSVDLKVVRFKFRLSGADTGTHRYVISKASIANSAAYAGTMADAVTMDFAGDASGASGDVEEVSSITLTGWKSAVTAGQLLRIRLARDGNATQDGSTVNSYSGPLVISYGITQ